MGEEDSFSIINSRTLPSGFRYSNGTEPQTDTGTRRAVQTPTLGIDGETRRAVQTLSVGTDGETRRAVQTLSVGIDGETHKGDQMLRLGGDGGAHRGGQTHGLGVDSVMRRGDQMADGFGDMSSYGGGRFGAESVASGFSETVTSADSERTDQTGMGSTAVLVRSKPPAMLGCWSWLERAVNTVSLSTSLGNVVRLPLAVVLHGGAPFVAAYLLLLVLLGLPLLFLELGVGQIVQQGLTKTWRAVPMFKGVGYVKLIANCIVCIYYPLYIGLALFYLSWLAKGVLPFTDCTVVKMKQKGYKVEGIPGQQCLSKTFLESPAVDPKWFGIFMGFLGLIWLMIMICSFRKTKAYMRSVNTFFIATVVCLIALLVRSVYNQIEFDTIRYFYESIDWTLLSKAEIWYYAIIQVLFSTHLGFGNVGTCAGKVYNKANPFWAAIAYFLTNLVVGLLSVMICYMLNGESLSLGLPETGDIAELYLFTAIYNNAVMHTDNGQIWPAVAFLAIVVSGFISVLTAIFTILKAIRVETKKRFPWWQATAALCFIFFTLGSISLIADKFKVAHILDHYVLGNLLLLATFLEIVAFVGFYGCSNIYVDFEFIMGNKLTDIWKFLWCLTPIIMVAVSVWAFATMRLTGLLRRDPLWMYATGWSIVLVCLMLVLVVAVYEVYIQVDYNFCQKFSSALKTSRKWGPVDPMLRHGWIQWRSKTGQGDRDFTLRRRGTRDYTHSIKHRKREPALVGTRYISTTNTNEATTLNPHHLSTSSLKSDLNENSLSNGNSTNHPLQVISITDTLERNTIPRILQEKYADPDRFSGTRNVLNPLGVPSMYGDPANESNSEGYGTIRNGPYIIAKDDFDHVCWRKSSSENATEL